MSPAQEPLEHEEVFAIDEIDLNDLGARLVELGEQLQQIGDYTRNQFVPKKDASYVEPGEDGEDGEYSGPGTSGYQLFQSAKGDMRRTLRALRRYRRSYSHWERLAVELALTRLEFTQREVAKDLGVGLSTVNRWAQNPLKPASDD